jgi:hypothetical protein
MYVYIDVYIQGSPVENLQNAGTGSAAAWGPTVCVIAQ